MQGLACKVRYPLSLSISRQVLRTLNTRLTESMALPRAQLSVGLH